MGLGFGGGVARTGVIGRVTKLITHIRGLITPLPTSLQGLELKGVVDVGLGFWSRGFSIEGFGLSIS